MDIQDAIDQALSEGAEDMEALFLQVKQLSKSKKADEEILEEIELYIFEELPMDIAANLNSGALFTREKLFHKTSFRIQLTPSEIQMKKVVIGHRMLPFLHPQEDPNDWTFTGVQGEAIPVTTHKFSGEEANIFITLMPPYGLDNFTFDLDKGTVECHVIDLSGWMKMETIGYQDQLLVSPVDYSNRRFQLEKVDSRKLAEQKLLARRKKELFSEALDLVVEFFEMPIPADISLFWTLANSEDLVIADPGTPLGPFLSLHEEFQIFQEGTFSYIHRKDFLDTFWETAVADAMNPDISKMGKATDLDGILAELSSTFRACYIRAVFIQQMHESGNIDLHTVYSSLFRSDSVPFFTDVQEENFRAALEKLAVEVQSEWKDLRLPLPLQNLLSTVIAFKMDFVDFLRQLDDKITDPEAFDFSGLLQFQPLDNMLDQILELLSVHSEQISLDEAKNLSSQIKISRKNFNEHKSEILRNLLR